MICEYLLSYKFDTYYIMSDLNSAKTLQMEPKLVKVVISHK